VVLELPGDCSLRTIRPLLRGYRPDDDSNDIRLDIQRPMGKPLIQCWQRISDARVTITTNLRFQ